MSERTIQVYRVTHVAEYLVENDEIYEDSVDMLRDVLEAARQGLLEFESTDHDFVAMEFDENSRMKVHVVQLENFDGVPMKSTTLPAPTPPPAPPRKLDDAPRLRPARKASRGRRRST